MRIMGWDLSMSATGVCFPDGSTAVIKPRGAGYGRLLDLEGKFTAALRLARPELVVVEDIRAGLLGDAAKVIPMVHATALLVLMRARVPYVFVNASTLKGYATGASGADKAAMILAAYKRAEREFTSNDECDAFWLRAAGHAAYGAPVVPLPRAHTEFLRVVDWPVLPGAVPVIEHTPAKRPKQRARTAA